MTIFAFLGLNESGQVIGTSNRYDGAFARGESAWLYNGGTTTEIGLMDSYHSTNSGYRLSNVSMLNEAGQVVGYSERFSASGFNAGETAWLYDANTNQTHSFLLSVQPIGNYAYSQVRYLGDDGLVLGTYSLFDSESEYLGERAFMFMTATGVHDLGGIVDSSFVDWNSLSSAIRANGLGMIVGNGALSNGNNMAYLLRPSAVPEPNALLLTVLGLMLFVGRRHRSLQNN